MTEGLRLGFEPLLGWLPVIVLAAAGVIAIVANRLLGGRAPLWRLAGLAVVLFGLAGPSTVRETRTPERDVVALVVDQSDSMALTGRRAAAQTVGADLAARLQALGDVDVRTRTVGSDAQGTLLFGAAREALADVPADRRAGVILVTDGQVHDVPDADGARALGAPVHAVLVGDPRRADRRLELVAAPPFAIVDQSSELQVRLLDPEGATLPVTVRVDGTEIATIEARSGEVTSVPFRLQRRGDATVSLSVPPRAADLSRINDTVAFATQGVKDRLRVLLVTGEPYPGARVWRNFLKSDPSVDLVHFTILRSMNLDDPTPIDELSLIAFPTRELFEERLDDFDLIIFDRYRNRGVLPPYYLENVAQWVERGGAIMIVAGPADTGPESLSRTPLAQVLPASPTGGEQLGRFVPALSDAGQRHPVTSALAGESWGPWTRLVGARAQSGQILMTGPAGAPLLVVAPAREGRVAQLFSDQVWLWARGWQGGGPHGELLRRLAHWLMQEPELEENRLTLAADGAALVVERRWFEGEAGTVTVTAPSGAVSTVELRTSGPNTASARLPAPEPGLWRAEAAGRTAWAAVGPASAREAADLATTDALLRPAVTASGGRIVTLGEAPQAGQPPLARGSSAPPGALPVPRRGGYTVTASRSEPFGHPLLWVIGGFVLMVLAWRREAR